MYILKCREPSGISKKIAQLLKYEEGKKNLLDVFDIYLRNGDVWKVYWQLLINCIKEQGT